METGSVLGAGRRTLRRSGVGHHPEKQSQKGRKKKKERENGWTIWVERPKHAVSRLVSPSQRRRRRHPQTDLVVLVSECTYIIGEFGPLLSCVRLYHGCFFGGKYGQGEKNSARRKENATGKADRRFGWVDIFEARIATTSGYGGSKSVFVRINRLHSWLRDGSDAGTSVGKK